MVTIQLHTNRGRVWSELRNAIKRCKKPAYIAVAYVGSAGSRLLPMRPDSRLVVDASELSVKAGRTCPAELLKLARNDVRIFSVSNLHAKIYVLDRSMYVGSANASDNSADSLVEAMLETNDRTSVASAKRFVQELCLNRLTEDALVKLQTIYRPPHFARPKLSRSARTIDAEFPPVRVVPLGREIWTTVEDRHNAAGFREAKRSRLHERDHQLDSFRWPGRSRFNRGEKVIQVTEENGGHSYVHPPGTVVHVRPSIRQGKPQHFVYLDVPKDQRRRKKNRVAKQLGHNGRKLIDTQGLVRVRADAARLLRLWER
jgi:hypothetical protein